MAVDRRFRVLVYFALVVLLGVVVPACGGGGGGQGDPNSQNPSLALVSFLQAGQDNIPLNRKLRFTFSEPVDMRTVGSGSIQIRKGNDYGETAAGEFKADPVGDPAYPTTVYFEPVLPNRCQEYSDAGFEPGTTYKVTVIGYPEQFAIRNAQGQPLIETTSYEFATRPESDPEFLEDQVPGAPPALLEQYPAAGTAALAVAVGSSNEIRLQFTENLDPCSLTRQSLKVHVYEWGGVLPRTAIENGVQYPDGSGHWSGFVATPPAAGTHPAEDQLPGDDFSWGGNARALGTPQEVPGERLLEQDFYSTVVRFVPAGGKLPENALVVVQLTFDILDFGGASLEPQTFSFTTENVQGNDDGLLLSFDDAMLALGEINTGETTADVNTDRSPEKAQGWMLFAGGGDNGPWINVPVFPIFDVSDPNNATLDYVDCDFVDPDGVKDHIDIPSGYNLPFYTGFDRVPASCPNEADGSTAVLYDFRTFRIRDGGMVTIIGDNPAIIRVQGDVVIEAGGELRVRGGDGEDGHAFSYYDTAKNREGGVGVAGSGDGGMGRRPTSPDQSEDGFAGYGSPDYGTPGEQSGQGSGTGGAGVEYPSSYNYTGASGGGGGGGGHAVAGQDGMRVLSNTAYQWATTQSQTWDGSSGLGGGTYPDTSNAEEMITPSAGSGGGGGGWCSMYNNTTYYYYAGDGGGGGAGGGFVDFTSQGNIRIFGLIDARGGDGGSGGQGGYVGGGGAGGGSGGGVRLLTPANIDLSGGSILTTGGRRGNGNRGNYSLTTVVPNDGGAGGHGRIVLEDGDSVITGFSSATLVPTDGQEGFYKGIFQSTRFSGGAGASVAQTTQILLPGQLLAPEFYPLAAADFVAGIPTVASRGADGTSMVVDMRGWPMLSDGAVGLLPSTEWYCVGHFRQGETPTEPAWYADTLPPDRAISAGGTGGIDYDNTRVGISNLTDVSGYVEVRIYFYTPSTNYGPSDPGPYVDDMRVRYNYDH